MSAQGRGAKRQEKDFYPTPLKSFIPILPHLPAAVPIWEPACGDRRLINCLRDNGFIADGDDLTDGYDFLQDFRTHDCIVTNPPFSIGFDFVRHAVMNAHEVWMLLPLNFLGSAERKPWFEQNEPTVFVLSERPSFVMACKCPACGHRWNLPVESMRPAACPKCDAPKLKICTSDMCNYAWFAWNCARGKGVFHL